MTSTPLVTIMGFTFNIYGFLILLFFVILAIGIWQANRHQALVWTDMITRDGTKVSTTKLLQLVGGVVATWVIIQLTIQEKITWDLFAIYLAYVASIDGYSKFILARYGVIGSDDSKAPYARRTSDGSAAPTPAVPMPPKAPVPPIDTSAIDDIAPPGAAKPH